MQSRMKKYQLTVLEIQEILNKSSYCTLSTINSSGYPYTTPMNYIYLNNKIYMHGLPKGSKIDNINNNSKVSISIYEASKLLYEEITNPCDVNVEYKSIIILGNAKIISDLDLKSEVLYNIVKKYTPHLSELSIPDNMLKGTAVIEIEVYECTGKYYK